MFGSEAALSFELRTVLWLFVCLQFLSAGVEVESEARPLDMMDARACKSSEIIMYLIEGLAVLAPTNYLGFLCVFVIRL